jgi:hypothetical protein|tara:strand:- start:934 stop:1242 length:309 start_codon:yes stop_codon:yes gene_type:complete
MYKKITYLIIISFFLTSCSGTFDSVKRGLTGSKGKSTDEFLIKKKDPLILPPDFESLPPPGKKLLTDNDPKIFEEALDGDDDENSTTSSSVENSILKKIQKK